MCGGSQSREGDKGRRGASMGQGPRNIVRSGTYLRSSGDWFDFFEEERKVLQDADRQVEQNRGVYMIQNGKPAFLKVLEHSVSAPTSHLRQAPFGTVPPSILYAVSQGPYHALLGATLPTHDAELTLLHTTPGCIGGVGASSAQCPRR